MADGRRYPHTLPSPTGNVTPWSVSNAGNSLLNAITLQTMRDQSASATAASRAATARAQMENDLVRTLINNNASLAETQGGAVSGQTIGTALSNLDPSLGGGFGGQYAAEADARRRAAEEADIGRTLAIAENQAGHVGLTTAQPDANEAINRWVVREVPLQEALSAGRGGQQVVTETVETDDGLATVRTTVPLGSDAEGGRPEPAAPTPNRTEFRALDDEMGMYRMGTTFLYRGQTAEGNHQLMVSSPDGGNIVIEVSPADFERRFARVGGT